MRKEKILTIPFEGRDKGKTFLLREMPAERAEKWGLRALAAAAKVGVDVGSLPSGGMAGIAVIGIEALLKVNFSEAEPLLDELFTCVKIIRDPRHPDMTFALVEDDIEEIRTRLHLRVEVLRLHVDFLLGAEMSKSTPETAPTNPASPTTPTSRPSSGQRSRITRPR